MAAKSREELNVAGRALDRVLRAEQFWVPNWHKGSHWIAHWDKFGRPATKPKYDRGIIDTWWYDEAKAARIAKRKLIPLHGRLYPETHPADDPDAARHHAA